MRTIGSLETEALASQLGDILLTKGIESQIEDEEDGQFSIWILDEDKVHTASEILSKFRENPKASEYARAGALAREHRERQEQLDTTGRSTVADDARIGYERHFSGLAYVTLGLMLLCGLVFIVSNQGNELLAIRKLFITEHNLAPPPVLGDRVNFENGLPEPTIQMLPEVKQGEIWRLATPIFIHFGWLHIIFNCMMLRELGSFIENRFGALYLCLLVLALAVTSNLGQSLWHGAPFGGMSGVDYGLFGFLWIRGKFDREAGWELNKNTITMLLAWFFACLVGLIPHVANTAHAVGLIVGMGWGFFSARR